MPAISPIVPVHMRDRWKHQAAAVCGAVPAAATVPVSPA